MQDNEQATVVLADDHNIVREGIAALCAANGMRILGQVADGPPAIEMIQQLEPDFAIIDLHGVLIGKVHPVGQHEGCETVFAEE